ncbi:MAG: 3D-(3,5/4)-trihydroxycyclohexane-1,2-dione acylhydrolase (decyclizing) [Luteitalea sp.]|nr:3D-(3,5/4)-trihydroxycyclohexane-1,2-dione acylhydrolase (decyclizing) [Luteitalea sp.]
MSSTRRLTVAQAIVEFLVQQHTRRDDVEQPLFAGAFAIFGHGNVAGLGAALLERTDRLRCILPRNEQAMVHSAVGFAKMQNRLQAMVCTTSIGPGATNMITGAAVATINRLPVLLLPGDLFATRAPAPVLQQLESAQSQDVSVNDCFKPVSRYWDRINRPEQVIAALPEAMRVLTSPAETGAVTLCLPQDVQTEAFDFPEALFRKRVWTIPRLRPDATLLAEAVALLRQATRPVIVAGGGVHYSGAIDSLRAFVDATGIAVVETHAGKGALPYDHPQALGAVGVTGTPGANRLTREADVVLVVGSRLSDFTTASKSAFQNPAVRFIGLNVTELDAGKHQALPLVADAQVTLDELRPALAGWETSAAYREQVTRDRLDWEQEIDRIVAGQQQADELAAIPSDRQGAEAGRRAISQGEVIGLLNGFVGPRDVIINAAGSLPGDLHKLWRARDPKQYHLEYGYSCMGYEIAAGLGVKLAAPDRDVYVLAGDGSYLMMAQEIATAVQEGIRLTILVLDNHGFASIGALSESVGAQGFATEYRYRTECSDRLDGPPVQVDFAANAASLGAHVWRAESRDAIREALQAAKATEEGVTAIVIPVDRHAQVGGPPVWWDVPVAETSTLASVQEARARYVAARAQRRFYL